MKITEILFLSSLFFISGTGMAFGNTYIAQEAAECTLCNPTQTILYEDSLAVIIKNRLSTLKTSLLIVPKKHIANLEELNLDGRSNQHLLAHLISLAQMLASRLTGAQSYRITVNSGVDLQDTPHLSIVFESNDVLLKA
jgi:hypothetical protein